MSAPRTYPAVVTGVHDGDSCSLSVSCGFSIHVDVTARLDGINAIELNQPGGKEARDHLIGMMPVGSAVTFTSVSYDKYGGRTDSRIVLANGVDVANQMVADGYAAAWNGKGVKPTPPWPVPAR